MKRSAVIVALVGLVVLASPAHATHVQCGDTVTRDTTLDSDLLNCPGPGLNVGANDIVVDLGGHTISGQAFGASVSNFGFDDVTIRNGRLEHRLGGVGVLGDADRNVITGLSVSGSPDGVLLFGDVDDTLVEGNFIEAPGRHFVRAVLIRPALGFPEPPERNVVRANVMAGGGIATGGSLDTLIDGNSITASFDAGIELFDGTATITGNRVSGGGADGILVNPPAQAAIDRNVVEGNADDGIDLDGPGSTVMKNKARRNGDLGIEAAPAPSTEGRTRRSATATRRSASASAANRARPSHPAVIPPLGRSG